MHSEFEQEIREMLDKHSLEKFPIRLTWNRRTSERDWADENLQNISRAISTRNARDVHFNQNSIHLLMLEECLNDDSLISVQGMDKDLARELAMDSWSIRKEPKSNHARRKTTQWLQYIRCKLRGRNPNMENVSNEEWPRTRFPEEIYDLAAIWIKDAINIRPHNMILKANTTGARMKPILVYKFAHNSAWSFVVNLCIWFHMFLAVWEPPVVPVVYEWTLCVEFAILFTYCFDIWLRTNSHDLENFWNLWWTKLCIFVVGLNLLEVILAFALRTTESSSFRITRLARPYFLIWKQKDLRRIIISISGSIPLIIIVALIMFLYIAWFGFAGWELFSRDNPNFVSFTISMRSLLVLITTANFPDVMMPSYHNSRISCSFFLIFIIVGLYFIMALSLAVIYQHFNWATKKTEKSIRTQREQTMDGVFDLLSSYGEDVQKQKNVQSGATSVDINSYLVGEKWIGEDGLHQSQLNLFSSNPNKEKYHRKTEPNISRTESIDKNERVHTGRSVEKRIFMNEFRRLIHSVRGNVTEKHSRVMYYAMSYDGDGSFEKGITKRRFRDLIYYIGVSLELEKSMDLKLLVIEKELQFKKQQLKRLHRLHRLGSEGPALFWMTGNLKSPHTLNIQETEEYIMQPFERREMIFGDSGNVNSLSDKNEVVGSTQWAGANNSFENLVETISIHWYKLSGYYMSCRRLIVIGFSNKLISCFVGIIIWLGTLVMMFEIVMSTMPSEFPTWLTSTGDVFLYIFLIEVWLRLIGFGWSYLWNGLNFVDFVIVQVSFFVEVSQNSEDQTFVVVFRLLRIFRLLRSNNHFKMIIRTSFAILPSFVVLMMIQFCVMYFFAIVGLFIFYGKISHETVETKLIYYNTTGNAEEYDYWQGINSSYYYDNNMNQVFRAIIVLLELMVVNNWMQIYGMYIKVTNGWAYIYFYSYFVLSIVIVVNVVIAFVVEAFVIQYRRFHAEASLGSSKWESRVREAVKYVFLKSSAHYIIKRDGSKALFYDSLFGTGDCHNADMNVVIVASDQGDDTKFYDREVIRTIH